MDTWSLSYPSHAQPDIISQPDLPWGVIVMIKVGEGELLCMLFSGPRRKVFINIVNTYFCSVFTVPIIKKKMNCLFYSSAKEMLLLSLIFQEIPTYGG